MTAIIQTQDLTKAYGDFKAVDGLSFEVREGEIYGFLGPNGAGKSTTILMLLGLTEPTSGRVRVLGLDPTREGLAVKRQVGYMPENVGFYGDMTASENLEYVALLNGLSHNEAMSRIGVSLDKVRLNREADKPVQSFSRGMRQRLGLAELILKQPRLVILDEPTLGLDPEGIGDMLKLIKTLCSEEGISVLLCSHLLQQVQSVCDRVGILNHGRLIAQGTIEELSAHGLEAEGQRQSLEDLYMHYFQEN
jgi:ABC-2 type transport system ATP-binding protein